MNLVLRKLVLSGLVLIAPVLAACSSGGDGGSDHNKLLGGVFHHDGYTDPLNNCVACHGATLNGYYGAARLAGYDAARHGGPVPGPSCYDCHNSNDHQTIRKGVRHNQPGIDCSRCHGPTLRGGLGPACVQSGCHSV